MSAMQDGALGLGNVPIAMSPIGQRQDVMKGFKNFMSIVFIPVALGRAAIYAKADKEKSKDGLQQAAESAVGVTMALPINVADVANIALPELFAGVLRDDLLMEANVALQTHERQLEKVADAYRRQGIDPITFDKQKKRWVPA